MRTTGNKVLAFFDVLSWGYGAYVYLQVTSPTGREIQKFEAESEGRVEFVASEDGEHNFCFKNAHSETEVSFWVNTETDSALSDVAKEGKLYWLYVLQQDKLQLSDHDILTEIRMLLLRRNW